LDTRRLLIAALLSLAIMIAWGYFFPPPEPVAPPQATATSPAEPEPTVPPPQETAPAEEEAAAEPAAPETVVETPEPVISQPMEAAGEERVVVTGETFRAEFTNRGAQLVSYQLLQHRNADGGPVDLVRSRAEGPYLFGFATLDGSGSPLNDVYFQVDRAASEIGQEAVTFRYQGSLGAVEKRFTFQPNGLVDLAIDASVADGWTAVLGPGIRNPTSEELDNRFARRSAVYRHAEGVERIDPARVKTAEGISSIGLQWVGLQDTYFLTAVVPQKGLEGVVIQPTVVLPGGSNEESQFRPFRDVDLLDDAEKDLEREILLLLQPQGSELYGTAFLGAKQFDRLAALPYGLEETVQLGWFKFLSLPLLWGLRWIHDNVVANYGWAIILMTILIRLVLFPLTHKSTVSMQKMQEINPKVQAIRNKYRGKLKDKQGRPNPEMQRKMNEETMALYKTEGVNPAGGCLPMLLQIPVLFAFYNILSTSIEIRHAPWILWITDLSAKDPLYVLPIVMGATQFLQQRMTPAAGDPMQRRMFALMPIFFTILFLGFPSGLVLYWLTNNVLGIGQQYAYKRLREAKQAEDGSSGGGKGKKGSKE
jgi:YidC/Oxa1 family membrane protein insertase